MTTYRQHQDTRDGKIYNCVFMPDGKWWSAENLAYNIAGSRVYADNPANEPIYGRLYNYELFTYAIMPGAHLPSALEFGRMINAVQAITGVNSAGTHLKSTDLWVSGAGTDFFGFDARPAGRFIPIDNYDGALGYVAYFASSELPENPASMPMIRYDEPGMTSAYLYEDNFVSVRFIVDVFNEPIPKPSDFFPPPGTYDNPITVTLNKSGMRYTLDGTDPTETSPFLDTPIRISGPTEIRLKSDAMPTVYAFAYLIKGRALPMYKQAVLWADGKTSPESITRTYHG